MANSGGIEIDDRVWFASAQSAFGDIRSDFEKEERARAEKVAEAARRYAARAPVHDPREPVLADSITVEEGQDEDGPYFEVGTSVPHGLPQEFGTSEMPAHPYMRPAIEENL